MVFRNIEAERVRGGFTKGELAKHLGVSQKTYWNWTNARTGIPSRKIIEMCKLFGVSADYLLAVNDANNPISS